MDTNTKDFIEGKFGKTRLWNLRQNIVMNSLFMGDYRNDYDLDVEMVCNFFEGYFQYLVELAKSKGESTEYDDVMLTDSVYNLKNYYDMCDFSVYVC